MAGSGIASITMKHNNSSLITSDTPVNVTVQINSIYSSQWAKYLEENGFDIINSNLSAVSARRDNTMLFIGDHAIDVSIT
jgi:ACT domain-containing protein